MKVKSRSFPCLEPNGHWIFTIEAGRALTAQPICDRCLVPAQLPDEIIITFKISWLGVEVFYPELPLPVEAFHQMRQKVWESVDGARVEVSQAFFGDHDGSYTHA